MFRAVFLLACQITAAWERNLSVVMILLFFSYSLCRGAHARQVSRLFLGFSACAAKGAKLHFRSMSEGNWKRTPLNAVHRELGGRMVDCGGWDMPVQYPA